MQNKDGFDLLDLLNCNVVISDIKAASENKFIIELQKLIEAEHSIYKDAEFPVLGPTEHAKAVNAIKPPHKYNGSLWNRIFIDNGVLVHPVRLGKSSAEFRPASTMGMHTTFDTDRAIYVITANGAIYFGNAKTDSEPYVYHDSFTDEETILAGLIEIKNGKIVYIDNCSGHFQPPKSQLYAVLKFLKMKDVFAVNAEVGYVWETDQVILSKLGLRIVKESLNSFFASYNFDNNLQTAFFWVNFDGITSKECGAGQFSVNNILAAERYNSKDVDLSLRMFLIGPNYSSSDHPGYSAEIADKHKEFCESSGGRMLLTTVPDITNTTKDLWAGGRDGWRALCKQAAADIHAELQILESDPSINDVKLVVNDTNYAQLVIELDKLLQVNPVRLVINALWIPHSTSISISGRDEYGEPVDANRFLWEQAALRYSPKCLQFNVQAIGLHMRKHLQTEYNVPIKFAPFRSGIVMHPYMQVHSKDTINQNLVQNGIPLDRDLIFCMGMGLAVKGHDLAILAFAKISKDKPNAHLVLLAPDRSSREPEYAPLLARLIEKHSLQDRVTWIKEFKHDLAQYMYAHEKTLVTMLPVRESPQDLIPMESRVQPVASVLLVSNRGSNIYQVTDGVDGYIADIGSPGDESIDDLSSKLSLALSLNYAERKRMIAAGIRKIACEYDAVKNFVDNFMASRMRNLALDFYRNGLFSFEDTELTHGNSAAVYVDCRKLCGVPSLREKVLHCFQQKLESLAFKHIAGVPMGASPLAAGLATLTKNCLLQIRPEQKGYGQKRRIEGKHQRGDSAVVLEDVITTGGSTLQKAIMPLEAHGINVASVVVLFDAGKGGVENLRDLGYDVQVVFPYCEFISYLGEDDGLSVLDCKAIAAMIEDSNKKLSIPDAILQEYRSRIKGPNIGTFLNNACLANALYENVASMKST